MRRRQILPRRKPRLRQRHPRDTLDSTIRRGRRGALFVGVPRCLGQGSGIDYPGSPEDRQRRTRNDSRPSSSCPRRRGRDRNHASACGKSAPPPPPKIEAPPAPAANEDVKRLATEIYVYAYPLVVMDVTKQVMLAKTPINTFQHRRAFPDTSSTDVVNPNVDTLSSQAWLDLAREPIVLSVPDTRDRYYMMPMVDAWTNVFQSPGKRTTGTKKGDFAIIGPKWKGELPKDVEEIRSPTEMVWLIGRTQTNGKADYAAVAKIQDQYKLTPLSQWRKSGAKAVHAPPAPQTGIDTKTAPVEQVAKMNAQAFFTRFASLLPGNPPAKEDAPVVEKMKKLGIVAGQPFDLSKLDAATAKGVEDGAKSAHDAIVAAAKGSTGDLRNGWTIHWDLGRYGANYGLRAVIASFSLRSEEHTSELQSRGHLVCRLLLEKKKKTKIKNKTKKKTKKIKNS